MKQLRKPVKEKEDSAFVRIMMPSLDGWESKEIPITLLTVEK